jgi:predicted kinase
VPALILICGLPGAGKTTLAKRLEQERPALRLTPDEWMTALRIDLFDESRRGAVEGLQWQVATSVLALGLDVILDWGFWSRAERDDYRLRATRLGARTELHYLGLSPEALWERVDGRNREMPPDAAHITRAHLEQYARSFEPPTDDEITRP